MEIARGDETDLAGDAELSADMFDRAVDVLRKRYDAANASFLIMLSGLRETLRFYQQRGFAFLARMADWAFGAMLGEYMGLD